MTFELKWDEAAVKAAFEKIATEEPDPGVARLAQLFESGAAAEDGDDGEELSEEARPQPIGRCPKCGAPWYARTGFCGGCGK